MCVCGQSKDLLCVCVCVLVNITVARPIHNSMNEILFLAYMYSAREWEWGGGGGGTEGSVLYRHHAAFSLRLANMFSVQLISRWGPCIHAVHYGPCNYIIHSLG